MYGIHLRSVLFAACCFALARFSHPAFADEAAIHADNCGIAAGHDANGNTITCNYGLTPDQLKELTRAAVAGATGSLLDRIETLSKRLGVSQEATKTLLKIVGEQPNVPDEDLTKTLSNVAIKYKNLQAQAASINADNPISRALVSQVQVEITAGRLQTAGDLLQRITQSVATLNGTCTKAEAGDVMIDAKYCLPQIMNTNYRDNRTAFTFVVQGPKGGATVISFSGDGSSQIHLDHDNVVQPIDKVVFTLNGSSDYLKAEGSCSFANPEKGTPAPISCNARTSEGIFAGQFISDGSSPNLFEAGAGLPVQHSTFSTPQVLKGRCDSSSHIAEGPIGEDLTKRQSRFFCDAAVIASFSDDPRHRLIQFADSQSNHKAPLGFGGLMQDAAIMNVRSVYLEISNASVAADGGCKFFFKDNKISGIACGAKIDEGNRRTVPVVAFDVDQDGSKSK